MIDSAQSVSIDLGAFNDEQKKALQAAFTAIKRNDDALINSLGQNLTTSGAGTSASFLNLTVTGTLTASIPPSSLGFKFGWVNFKDVAGTITINGSGGNVALTVGFRTGTAAGDYTLTSGTAFADAFWVATGTPNDSTGVTQLILAGNPTNPLHTTTQWNFVTFSRGAGANTRVSECMLWAVGN